MSHLSAPRRGVVAAGHPLSAAAGAEMLKQGGNAFDAAIAAVMTAWVSESVLTSAGGGGFLLAHTAAGEDCLFDFFTQTPLHHQLRGQPDFYPVSANFGTTSQEFHIGLGSIAVPGAIAGLLQVHRRLGSLPLAAIVEPAIHHAKSGVAVTPFLAYVFSVLEPILKASAASRDIYAPGNQLLTVGNWLKMPDLAAVLTQIAEQGASAFYEGAIAQQIVQDCQSAGGYLTLDDLKRYQVIERRPLSLSYQDHTVLTNPPPSSGGLLIAFALTLMKQMELSTVEHGSADHAAWLTQIMALTNEARRHRCDDQLYTEDIVASFLDEDFIALYQPRLSSFVNKLGSTTHVSVIDAEGNAASVTTSNGEGSSYVVPSTAIMMNNMLGEEDLHPGGFHTWKSDQRISSMMAPSILLKDGTPRLVLGSGGSNRIRTAILQAIANVVDFGMTLSDAVAAPRLHWERDILHLEPGFTEPTSSLLSEVDIAEVVRWQEQNMFFGGVHAVSVDDDGELHGIGDARRGGSVAIV